MRGGIRGGKYTSPQRKPRNQPQQHEDRHTTTHCARNWPAKKHVKRPRGHATQAASMGHGISHRFQRHGASRHPRHSCGYFFLKTLLCDPDEMCDVFTGVLQPCLPSFDALVFQLSFVFHRASAPGATLYADELEAAGVCVRGRARTRASSSSR